LELNSTMRMLSRMFDEGCGIAIVLLEGN
jgi:hypothetical protein